jgi:hypothetical protein
MFKNTNILIFILLSKLREKQSNFYEKILSFLKGERDLQTFQAIHLVQNEHFRPSNVPDRFLTFHDSFMSFSCLKKATNGRKRLMNVQKP